jgi:phosphotransferase system enzyme I (PtsP)
LQFLIRSKMPQRAELARLYARVMDAAKGKTPLLRGALTWPMQSA